MIRGTLLLLFFYFYVVLGFSQESTAADDTSEELSLQPIAISEITNEANAVQIKLDDINKQLNNKAEFKIVKEELDLLLDSIDMLNPDEVIGTIPDLNSRQLLTVSQKWTSLNLNLGELKETLASVFNDIQNAESHLSKMREIWDLTAKEVYISDVPSAVRKRVSTVLNDIKKTETHIASDRKALLLLQENVSSRELQIVRLLTAIEETEAESLKNIFTRDSPFLVNAFREEKDSAQTTSLQETINDVIASNTVFLKDNRTRFIIHLVIFLLLIALFYLLRYRVNNKLLIVKSETYTHNLLHYVDKPIISAALMSVFLSIWLYPFRTLDFGHFIIVISIIPVVLIIPYLLDSIYHRIAYLIVGLAIANYFCTIFYFNPLHARIAILVTNAVSFSLPILIYAEKKKIELEKEKRTEAIIFKINGILILLLASSFILNIYGTVILSNNIFNGLVLGLYLGLLFLFVDKIITGLSGILFRKKRKRAFIRIAEYAPRIEHTIERLIHLAIFFYWFRATTSTFGAFELIQDWYNLVLNFSWEIGNTTLRLATIIDFILILVFSSIIARTARIILDLEVFPRIKLPRGVAGAISMVTRYTIVGFGIFLAISNVTDLSKLGVMTGAIGVGLGFGLQGVIANFVSGIIISFERPMQVGDMIEINNIQGNVDEIGVRSCTIKTFDGSEVIVPNNDFISTQFTNWTLTDPKRRIKLNIKVALSANPHDIIHMFSAILEKHPGVHTHPEPVVTFDGFGDYFLEFTLYYWISENILQYKSEIALLVYDAVLGANLQIPVPRQDLNINVEDKRNNII